MIECDSIFVFSSRRRHTRFDCDWSSDVCSSDLRPALPAASFDVVLCTEVIEHVVESRAALAGMRRLLRQIGRGAGRGRGENSVGAVSLKKKKKERVSESTWL